MYSSKKQRHNKKRTTKKFKGGQVKDVIKATHPGLIGPAMNFISNTTNKLASNTITGASNLLGVDITNKSSINDEFKKATEILSDSQMRENIKNIISEGAQTLAIGLEAAKPAINQFVETTTDAVEKSASKIGKAGVSIALNTLEEIPVAGIVVGTIRSLDKAAQAAQSVFNAGSEIITASGDAANQIAKNIENASNLKMLPQIPNQISNIAKQLPNITNKIPDIQKQMQNKLREKTQILNKVGGSIAEFHDSTLNPDRFLLQNGGKTRRNNKKKTQKNMTRRA
jgi:hypothetical protein